MLLAHSYANIAYLIGSASWRRMLLSSRNELNEKNLVEISTAAAISIKCGWMKHVKKNQRRTDVGFLALLKNSSV